LTKPLIQNVECRLLLKVFIDGQCNDIEFGKLKELLIMYSPSIGNLIDILYLETLRIEKKTKLQSYAFVSIWKYLLLMCTSSKGVVFSIHSVVVCILRIFLKYGTFTLVDKHLVSQLCPVIGNLIDV
jgi:hypothetical protein